CAGMETGHIHAVGNHLDTIRGHTAPDIGIAHGLTWHPNFVHLPAERTEPLSRQAPVFPRLNQHPAALTGRCPDRRPLVTDMDGGPARRGRASVHALGE